MFWFCLTKPLNLVSGSKYFPGWLIMVNDKQELYFSMLSIHVWFCHGKMDLFVRLYMERIQLALVTAKCNSAVDCILPAQGVS